jgi:uncharacterized protein YtpQ (UPF0354 family)
MTMKRFLQVVLSAIGFCSGCSKPAVLTPAEFTKEYAAAMRKASPGLTVEVVNELRLKVTSAGGRESTSFLNNAYDAYKQDPEAKAPVMQRFVEANVETPGAAAGVIDRTRIVPVIKDRPWLEETRQALSTRGVKTTPEYVCEDFTPDLVILYAQDSPRNIRYLVPKDLADAKIERRELRSLACANLKRLLPKIERHGANGFYMVTAGGNYEASLLLLDSIWSGGQMDVQGDVVVAIPTRDLLLVTGSDSRDGIKKMKEMVRKASSEGSYRLTQKLFVYRRGRFAEFEGGTQDDAIQPSP